MPFPASWIEEKIVGAFEKKKLGHSFLLTGSDLSALQTLFYQIAAKLLGSPSHQHPDLHLVQPESKTRRILIDQIRELQHAIQLKSFQASCKIVGIFAADRMCAGSAEAAQAFLKTLEEPPENTFLFLLTEEPNLLLPTIRSRCLFLPLKTAPLVPSPALTQLYKEWENAPGTTVDQAYRRAALLSSYWQEAKAELEETFKSLFKQAETEDAEKTLTAQIESKAILAREQSLAYLLTQLLEGFHKGEISLPDFERTVQSFDELRTALALNLDPSLALERCCLKINKVV